MLNNKYEDCEREKGKDYVESPVFQFTVTPDAFKLIGICWHSVAIQTLSTECSLSVPYKPYISLEAVPITHIVLAHPQIDLWIFSLLPFRKIICINGSDWSTRGT